MDFALSSFTNTNAPKLVFSLSKENVIWKELCELKRQIEAECEQNKKSKESFKRLIDQKFGHLEQMLQSNNDMANQIYAELKELQVILQKYISKKDHADHEMESNINVIAIRLDNFEHEQRMINTDIVNLNSKFDLLKNVSYDGRFIWKIDQIHFRIHRAVNHDEFYIHSSYCFTKRGGYKFCAR